MALRKTLRQKRTPSFLDRICPCVSEVVRRVRIYRRGHIRFDEENINVHMSERGVLYGTMAIPDCPTPFLVYDEATSRAEGAIFEVGENQQKSAVSIVDLQARLGMLEQVQLQGQEVLPTATRNVVSQEQKEHMRNAPAQQAAAAFKATRRVQSAPSPPDADDS
eukprot:TRINITY_DN7201_c0_g1_i2.p1 TRINITY_DN7201_c0_g1~~TRINITY_DN7201_c0_g1_i2.p1  ORF type:complete len:164 (-),score=36.11 TRINITY_DN7201_c0_g1_i2:59-550(-)